MPMEESTSTLAARAQNLLAQSRRTRADKPRLSSCLKQDDVMSELAKQLQIGAEAHNESAPDARPR
jgi:hypothetical protein